MRIHTTRQLGSVLRSRRKDLHLTQSALAEAAEVTRQWVAALEKGKPTAEIGRCLRVIDALELDVLLELRPSDPTHDAAAHDLDRLLHQFKHR